MSKALIQTRVPIVVFRWMKKQCDSEGISYADWLRRLVLKAYNAALEEN